MPHLVILYTPNLETKTDVSRLCRLLADEMLAIRDEANKPVFPIGGTRVLAFPAAHCAVADGQGDYGFMYLNLRMAGGRSAQVKQDTGDRLMAVLKVHVAPMVAQELVGVTLQIDESPAQVYDGRHSSLHPHFNR